MTKPYSFILLLFVAALIAGCASPGALGVLPGLSVADTVDTPHYVQVPPDATATPTPFRPIPPTAVFQPTYTPTPTFTPSPSPTPTSIVDAYLAGYELEQLPNQFNILLLGADQRPPFKGKRFRTDTIILATINKDLGTVNLTSFPRDLYINIPGQGTDRINTAYFYGGMDMLKQTFKQNFGVNPEHYILINFQSFKKFIDDIGGLEVEVGTELSDYRNGYWTTIPAGKVHMDADTVLWYVRSRKTSNDFARNRRQQEVIKAIMEEVLTLKNIARVPELYDYYNGLVDTDMGLTDFLAMLPVVLKLMNPDNIHQFYIQPGMTSSYITPGGAMVLLPDMNKIRKVVRRAQNLEE